MGNCNPVKGSTPVGGGIIKTSDVSIYDGTTLSCILGITSGTSNLNQVITAIDNAICAVSTPESSGINYDGSITLGSCSIPVTPAVNPTVNDAFTSIADYICSLESTVNNRIDILNTGDIVISGTLIGSDCIGTFTGTDTIETYLSAMASYICAIPPSTPSTVVDLYDYESITRGERVWVGEGGDSVHSGASLIPTIQNNAGGDSRYYLNGIKFIVADTTVNLAVTRDNYVDITDAGTYLVIDVAIGSPAPPVGGGHMRIAKYETNGTGVVTYTDLREFQYQDGERWFDDSVITRHILDLNVTGAKLENFGTAGTNDWSLASFTVDAKGRVQSWTNNTTITSLADNDILKYNLGTGQWENVPLSSAAVAAGTIQGETLYYDTGSGSYLPSTYLRNMPGTVGIGASGIPVVGLQMGNGVVQSFELQLVTGIGSIISNGGSLAANTYYYNVVAIDNAGGESLINTEEAVTVDGVTQTEVILSWSDSARATKYRIYKGVATGVYTEYFEVTADLLSFSDTGAAGTAGTPVTDPTAFATSINNLGIAIGSTLSDTTMIALKDIGTTVVTGVDLDIQGVKNIETVGVKSFVTATNTATNVGGWFSVLNGASNYVLRVEDGVDNTGKFLKVIDAAGNVDFGNAGIDVEDEGSSVLTDVNVIDFIGTGVTASTPSAGRVEVTITGGANALNDLTDVTAPSANDWDTLAYDLGTAMWVTSGALSNDLTNVAIGDKPGTIDARLHINSTNGSNLLKVQDSVVGVVCEIDTSGVLTYNERFKYTFNNGGAAPLGANKFLMSADALGNAEWETIPAFSIGFSGTQDYVTRWTTNTDLGIGVIRDNGSTVGIGLAPNATSQVDVLSGREKTMKLTNNGSLANSNVLDVELSSSGAVSGNSYLIDVNASGASHAGNITGVFTQVITTATLRNTGILGGANNAVQENVGVDGSANNSQGIDVGVRGGANTNASLGGLGFSAIGIISSVAPNTNNLQDSAVYYGSSVVSNANDYYGLVLDLNNTGTGTQYIGRFDDNRTVGIGKVLTDIDGAGTAEWATLAAAGISFNGINDYVTRWTPDANTLGTGVIRDNGTTTSISTGGATAPAASTMLFVASDLDSTITVDNSKATGNTFGMSVASFGAASVNIAATYRGSGASDSNIGGIFNGEGSSATWVVGTDYGISSNAASTTHKNIGVWASATGANTDINIGLQASASFGSTNYGIQLEDGTEGIGKFLKSITVDGKANWSSIALADLTDPYVYEQVSVSIASHNTGTEHTIFADTSSNDVTVNLPAAASNDGRVFVVKKTDAANKVVLDGNLAETIDGVATHEMFGLYDWVKVQCDGTEWFIIA